MRCKKKKYDEAITEAKKALLRYHRYVWFQRQRTANTVGVDKQMAYRAKALLGKKREIHPQ